MPTPVTDRLGSIGRWFFGVAVICSGVQQLFIQAFVRLVPKLPAWFPVPALAACVVGVILIVIGAAIISGKFARPASMGFVALLLLTLFVLYLPGVVSNPWAGFMWTNPCKTLALCGGAFILAAYAPGRANGVVQKLAQVAPFLLALFLVVCGVQHFIYAGFVDSMVPAWIPPNQRFWTIFAAIALIAGGIGILVPPTARLAAALSSLMIFLWIILLHIPRAAADFHNAGETSAIFEALALSGVALLLASRAPRNRA
ncbi:MAG TPA: DoxX family membrane protein [Candidatus Didemnitutus sp.]|nr:DoxX family membrane protein [Candidatus Didemnitutus sp.]